MSKVLALYHIVFGTKQRRPVLDQFEREHLCRVIWSILKEENCYLYRINCVADHVHLLVDLCPVKSLSGVMSRIKSLSSNWIKHSGKFPLFDGWCDGYYASSVSLAERDIVVDYIKDQQKHHADMDFESEMRRLYIKSGLAWHEKDLL